jgi:hypothetical protein
MSQPEKRTPTAYIGMQIAYYSALVRLLDACKYWQGVSECDCDSPLPTGGCLRCDMDEAVELLTQIIEANTEN